MDDKDRIRLQTDKRLRLQAARRELQAWEAARRASIEGGLVERLPELTAEVNRRRREITRLEQEIAALEQANA